MEGCDSLGLHQVSHLSHISPLSVIAENDLVASGLYPFFQVFAIPVQ